MVRITGGKLKGRQVFSSSDKSLRPTTSFFREWLFNVLGNITEIEDITLLDLFSGTGIVSFEFISRGAAGAVCVDRNREMCAMIKKSIAALGNPGISVINSECSQYLERIKRSGRFGFNTVFIDAPYSDPALNGKILSQLFSMKEFLPEDITIIVEMSKSYQPEEDCGFETVKSRSTGSTRMDILRRKDV